MKRSSARRRLVITTADEAYYPLARELMGSIRLFAPDTPFGLLDVGLTKDQVEELRAEDVKVATAQWNFSGSQPTEIKRTMLAMLARPFLPEYFPEADVLVYLDADTWVQNPRAISDLVAAAGGADVAVVPEVHCAYGHLYDPRHWAREMHRAAYATVYGRDTPSPADTAVLNVGVLAASANSRIWKVWQQTLATAVAARVDPVSYGQPCPLADSSSANFFIEQNAFNNAFLRGAFQIRPLSALYNWVCTLAAPMLNTENGLLVEPTLPHAPISIVHLTGHGRKQTRILGLDGKQYDRPWRWSGPKTSGILKRI